MKGWLIVNNFLKSGKFDEIYSYLLQAAGKYSVELELVRSGMLPHSVSALKNLSERPDFALFWDKDIVLARQLEICGLRLFNRASAVEKCDNKAYTYIELDKAGIPFPETYIAPLTFEGVPVDDLGFAEDAAARLGFPLVVKELAGSFGKQVYLAENMDALKGIISGIGCKGFLLQKFAASSRGRDIRVNVVGGKVICSMLRYSVAGDFRSNVTLGGHALPYDLNDEQTEISLRACEALGLDFAGVDLLFGEDGKPLICEVNSNPHFKSSLDVTGHDLSEYIIKHVIDTLG
ncbi:MAG: RimK family alpha-L-glutamate ligase [Clostridia bacterium]|nr:RimK family alpha-L-glutamate ligase [Clostridia bacterium]